MIIFACDTCAREKRPQERWILGFAAQSIGITATRREVSIASAWDNNRALDWLAVHFCSDACRSKYMEEIFRHSPKTLTGERTAVTRRLKQFVSGGSVETLISEKKKPTVGKAVRGGRQKRA